MIKRKKKTALQSDMDDQCVTCTVLATSLIFTLGAVLYGIVRLLMLLVSVVIK